MTIPSYKKTQIIYPTMIEEDPRRAGPSTNKNIERLRRLGFLYSAVCDDLICPMSKVVGFTRSELFDLSTRDQFLKVFDSKLRAAKVEFAAYIDMLSKDAHEVED